MKWIIIDVKIIILWCYPLFLEFLSYNWYIEQHIRLLLHFRWMYWKKEVKMGHGKYKLSIWSISCSRQVRWTQKGWTTCCTALLLGKGSFFLFCTRETGGPAAKGLWDHCCQSELTHMMVMATAELNKIWVMHNTDASVPGIKTVMFSLEVWGEKFP